MKKELRLKPCKQMHLSVLIFVIIIATCISELIAIIYFNGWLKFLYVNLGIFGFDLFSIGFYLLNEKLSALVVVVTQDEIIEYKNKEIVFRIKKEQIDEIAIYSMPIKEYLYEQLRWLFMQMGGAIVLGDKICIRYYNAEVELPEKLNTFDVKKIQPMDGYRGKKEYFEWLSKKQIKKIGEMLNIEIKNL